MSSLHLYHAALVSQDGRDCALVRFWADDVDQAQEDALQLAFERGMTVRGVAYRVDQEEPDAL